MTLAEQIIGMVKEGLGAWKTFIATRQEAYNRKMDKRKEKAIQYAETGFEKMGDVFQFLSDNNLVPDDKMKQFNKLKEQVYRYKSAFNKYD